MRKLLLLLFALLTSVSGAWATVTQPTLTTDTNHPVYYTIKSYRSNKYAAYTGASSQLAQVASTTSATLWYFVENSDGVSIVPADAPTLKLATNSSATAAGAVWYLKENPYNTGYFCVSLKEDLSGQCWDDNSTHTGVGYWRPAGGDYQGTSWTIEQAKTIPSGYYYFKGMDTERYPYLYTDFVEKGSNQTYHHSLPVSPSNGHIWKVTNNGTTFSLTNGEGLYLTTAASKGATEYTTYETLSIGSSTVGLDFYFTEAINLTNWGDDTQLTTWAGHSEATDNHWTFERVDVSDGVYDVVIVGHSDGYVTYSGQNAKNGGFFVAASIIAGDLTAATISNYTPSINVAGNTITVTYTATYTYTITDTNGETYSSWTATGSANVSPTITGCDGYTLSKEVWNQEARTYTADITFPFPVSSNSVTNWTYVNIFDKKTNYKVSDGHWFYWHANDDGDKIIAHDKDEPTNESGKIDKYKWSIIPSFANGAFTFTIENASNNKYICYDDTETYDSHTGIKLGDTGVSLTYVKDGSADKYYWYIPSKSKYISANSVTGGTNQRIGAYSGVHDGETIGFYTPANFTILMALLKTARTSFNNYLVYFNNGTYVETVEGKMLTAYTNDEVVRNVVKDSPTQYITATQFTTYTSAYNDAVNGLVPNVPAGSFIRIKTSPAHISTPTYLTSANVHVGGYDNCAFTQDDDEINGAETILYYDGTSLLGYSTGYWMRYDAGYVVWYDAPQASGVSVKFEKNVYGAIGMANIKFNNARYISTNNSTPIYTWAHTSANEEKYNFVIEDVEDLPVTITSAKYATLYTPVALEVPTDVTAFWGEDDGANIVLHAINSGSIIPANNGVILYSETAGTYDFAITTGGSISGTNAIKGTVATKARSGEYTLQMPGPAFYADAVTNLQGFKAYLDAGSTPVRGFVFDEETAVKAIEAAMNPGKVVYDMNGRRVENPSRGLYIVNGKKVIIK